MIGIINYGLGNIAAFSHVYKHLDIPYKVCTMDDDLRGVERFVLPGVGSFDYAVSLFEGSGMKEPLIEQVIFKGKPVLGICVGMQLLASTSEEGRKPGLSWIEGNVKLFQRHELPENAPLPHMGWNHVLPFNNHPLFRDTEPNARYYFLHSYYYEPDSDEHSIAKAKYGFEYTCSINKDNIYGVQFHPEKSHQNGVQILKNFATI